MFSEKEEFVPRIMVVDNSGDIDSFVDDFEEYLAMSKVSKVDIMLIDEELAFICDAQGEFETCDYTDGYKNRCPYKRDPGCSCINNEAINVSLKNMKHAICNEIKKREIEDE